jgi:hypothetical protein
MNRLRLALGIYVALALLAWFTLSDSKIRIITIAILAMFAVRTLTFSKRSAQTDKPDERDSEEQ